MMGAMLKLITNHLITRQILFGIGILLLFLATWSSRTTYAQPQDEVIQTVENHYGTLIDLTAKVVQKNILKAIERIQTFEGTLWIKKPGKLRLEYTNGQLILIDGDTALFYSKKSEQVVKKKFTDFQQMNIPVAFLLGAAHIRDDFEVVQPDPQKPRFLELHPRKQGAAMKKITIQADDGGRIMQMAIFDRSGNITEIAFSDVKEETGVKDKSFVFKAPKGTEIIEQ